jgi:hypothetical protein
MRVKFAAAAVLLFAVLAGTCRNARASDLSTLLDRMRARSGPVWRLHLESASTLVTGGRSAELRSEAENTRFLRYQCAGELCQGEYFDGKRLESVDINGTPLPESAAPGVHLLAERTIASLAFLDPAFVDDGGTITDEGTTKIHADAYRTLLVSAGDYAAMHVYVDPKTALVRYMRDIDGDATLEYRDYRRVGGIAELPFLVLRNGEPLERYHTRTVASGHLVPPHGLSPVYSALPSTISMNLDSTIPIFHCSLAGIATTCLLDSGNSGLAVSDTLAQQLHLPNVGSLQVRGLGDYATGVVRAGPLTVANVTYPDADYVVLSDIHRFGYDVVLGADVLASTKIELDEAEHTITFDPPAAAGGVNVPLLFSDFVPVLPVQLGAVGTQLALDTGDESNINLAYGFYREHQDLFTATEVRHVDGIGGDSIEMIGSIPDVRVGALDLRDQTIGATRSLRGTAFGHLGAGLLKNLRVIFDYAGGRVQLLPASQPSPPS